MGQRATCVRSQSGWSDLSARERVARVKVLHMPAALALATAAAVAVAASADAAADAAFALTAAAAVALAASADAAADAAFALTVAATDAAAAEHSTVSGQNNRARLLCHKGGRSVLRSALSHR